MRISKQPLAKALLPLAIASVFSTQLMAASTEQEIDALWQTIGELQQQVATAEEWKNPNSLIHMAGYADANFIDTEDGSGTFKIGSFSPIFHYQYRDLVMLESEIAFTVLDDGSTEVDVEYFTTDLFLNDNAILVMGKFLSPLGQFRQNYHPSWINKLPAAPIGFGHDQAAPNADVGFQLRGGFNMGESARANYAVYMGNGVATELNTAGDEIEAIESPGLNNDTDRDKNFGGRFGMYYPSMKLDAGLSWATGRASDIDSAADPRDWDFIGADITWHLGGLDVRTEYVKQSLGNSNTGGAQQTAEFSAYYGQVAYRFLPTKWEAVARISQYKTPEGTSDRTTAGVNYIFASNVIGKLAYESNDNDANDAKDRILLQLAYGF